MKSRGAKVMFDGGWAVVVLVGLGVWYGWALAWGIGRALWGLGAAIGRVAWVLGAKAFRAAYAHTTPHRGPLP